ncbi:unnamed protein product [Rotaria sp. Silwood2]|nr:unnamed protein product [Rotaria sp. Silwood2]
MNERNTSTRGCTLNRRVVERSEVYHVVIFPCDNSFSVVKSKQCSPAEQDGFVLVQSGHKKYMGFIFETGKIEIDRRNITKLFFNLGNFEICSKAVDRLMQKQRVDIESDYERRNENTQSKDITSNTSEKPTYTTLKDVPFSIDIPVNVIHNESPRQTVSNLTTTTTTATSINSNNSPSSPSIRETSLVTKKKSSSANSSSNFNCRIRPTIDSSPSPPQNKKKKKSKKIQEDNISSSDIESDNEDFIRTNEIIKTPTFNGRRITTLTTTASIINVPSSIFTSTDGVSSIDLMKIPATRDKANLYVTNLIEILYTIDELVALKPEETHNDYRYQLIRESVRCKFKLTNDQLDQLFNDWLREVFLAKRRVAVRKLKMSMNNE